MTRWTTRKFLAVVAVWSALIPIALVWVSAVSGPLNERWIGVGLMHALLALVCGLGWADMRDTK